MAHDKSLVALFCGEDKGLMAVKLVDTSQEDKDICIDEVLIDLKLARATGKKTNQYQCYTDIFEIDITLRELRKIEHCAPLKT